MIATPSTTSTTPVARFRVAGLALLAKRAAMRAHNSVDPTQNTRHHRSGIPPMAKWLTAPVKAVKVMINTLDYAMNPQEALDAPRWQWVGGKTIEMERAFPNAVVEELRRRGHDVVVKDDIQTYGRGQIIWRDDQGTLMGGTEPRADGCVAAW